MRVHVVSGAINAVQFGEGAYQARYLIRTALLKSVPDLRDSDEVRTVLDELRQANDALRLCCDVALRLIRYQQRYIESGDTRDLRCLSQASLARAIRKHPSTILRVVHGRAISVTRDGTEHLIRLDTLCGRGLIATIIKAITASQPTLTDAEICRMLRTRYGAVITRRTVNYHRIRFQKRRPVKAKRATAGLRS